MDAGISYMLIKFILAFLSLLLVVYRNLCGSNYGFDIPADDYWYWVGLGVLVFFG